MRPKHEKERFQQSNSNANLVNLVQNTNKIYKNVSHNIGSKTPQTISHNHIKNQRNQNHRFKNTKKKHQEHSSFINQFALRHQLACQT